MGKAEFADSVEVRWPDGAMERMEHVKANQFLKLTHEAKTNGVKR
jgi:hypothetical protein